MKKYLLTLSSLLFFFFFVNNAFAQDVVLNGANTKPINFPAGSCTYTWTNNNTSIGLAASGTDNIPSFTAVNTGSSPVTATITGTPVSTVGLAYIVNASSNNVSVINIATSAVLTTIPVGSNPNAVCVDPNYNEVYVVNNSSNTVSVISTLTNTVTNTIAVGPSPWSVTVSKDGSRAYVADGGDNDVEVINTTTNTKLATIPAGTNPNALAVSPDGSLIYVNNNNSVTVINTSTQAVIATIPVGSAPQAILITPDGSKVYEANYGSNNVYVINTATNSVAGIIPVGVNPGGGSISPDGSLVYIANEGSNSVSVISTATNAVIKTIPVGASPWGVSVRPDGTQVYVANSGSNTVSVVNSSTNAIITTIPVGSAPYSFGSFFTAGADCTELVKYTITVNPTSATLPAITAGTATGTISACVGTASASPQIQQFTVNGSGLSGNITATAPTGFEVSLAAVSGYANNVTIPQISGAVNSMVVYVRSAATDAAGSISGSIMLTSAGAGNQTVAVNGTVNSLPSVNAVANQIVNNGAVTAAVNFIGTGNTFTWTNDIPGIGLAASGSGDIASFTAVNTGSSPVKATITVTPKNAGYAYITNNGDGTVSVINTITNLVVATIPLPQQPFGVTVSPTGSFVYISDSPENEVSVISTATNTVVNTIPSNGSIPRGMCVSPDGRSLYVVNEISGNVAVINTASGALITSVNVGISPYDVCVSLDGSRIYVTNQGSNSVSIINTISNTVINTLPVGQNPNGIAISPDGSQVYVTNGPASSISVINTTTNIVTAISGDIDLQVAIVISPNGNYAYVSNGDSGSVSVFDIKAQKVISTIQIPGASGPFGISINSDGSEVYVANQQGTVSVINTITNTITSTINVGLGPISFGNFITPGSGCGGIPVTFTIIVEPTRPTITATTATGTISACTGQASASPNIQQFTVSGSGLTGNITANAPNGFELSFTAGSGYGSSVVLAQTGGAVSNTIVYVRSAASLPNSTTTANVLLTSQGAPSQNVLVTATVNPILTASLSIATSTNNICAGTPVTFTATPTNGGTSPVYQWLINGSNAGTNSPTFSSSTFANGDLVSCVISSSYACVAPAIATSNTITMSVVPDIIPSVSIAASQNAVCAGTMIIFTATQVNGGDTPVYQWLVNGNNAGTNSSTFSGSNFTNGDIVSCVITSNATCATPVTLSSNSINISVNPLVSPAVSITASENNVCAGTMVIFTATPINGGSSPVYQWLLNNNNTGINSPTFASKTLMNGDVISCQLTSNANCLTISDATSNDITMIVNAQVVPSVSVKTSTNGVCAGTPVTFTASPANGGDSPIYQWLQNGSNAGTNSSTFSSSTFANGDMVSCMMTSSSTCAIPAKITSNSIVLNIFPLPVVNAGGNKTIEKGSSVTLTATASENIAGITWSPFTGLDNNKILNPKASPPTTTLYTITVQTSAGCMATDSVVVTVLYGITIPNTFTPNGDGINDKWDIQNLNNYQNCVVRVFDRYGGEVYSSKGQYNAWDGTINGRRCPVGTYYYLINLNDGKQPLSGFVALIR